MATDFDPRYAIFTTIASRKGLTETSVLHRGTMKILVWASVNDVDSDGEFYVHKSLLQNHSPYFRALENFKEGQEDLVEFEEMCPIAFGLFASWLYTKSFADKPESSNIGTLIRAYAIGERFLIPEFKDYTITQIQRVHLLERASNSPADLETVQNHGLSPSSNIARYFIDYIAYRTITEETHFMPTDRLLDDDRDFFHRGGDMVVQLVEKILQTEKHTLSKVRADGSFPTAVNPSTRNTCYYHEHKVDDYCALGFWKG